MQIAFNVESTQTIIHFFIPNAFQSFFQQNKFIELYFGQCSVQIRFTTSIFLFELGNARSESFNWVFPDTLSLLLGSTYHIIFLKNLTHFLEVLMSRFTIFLVLSDCHGVWFWYNDFLSRIGSHCLWILNFSWLLKESVHSVDLRVFLHMFESIIHCFLE